MPLTQHFSVKELLACGDPWPPEVEPDIIRVCQAAEVLRHLAGDQPLTVTSAYRSPQRNLQAGGAQSSQHLFGRALDLSCRAKTGLELFLLAATIPEVGGVGLYAPYNQLGKFIHIDTRRRTPAGAITTWYFNGKNYAYLPAAVVTMLTNMGIKVA